MLDSYIIVMETVYLTDVLKLLIQVNNIKNYFLQRIAILP